MHRTIEIKTEDDVFGISALVDIDENGGLLYDMPCFTIYDENHNNDIYEIWDNESYLNKFYKYLINDHRDLTKDEISNFDMSFSSFREELTEIFIDAYRIGILKHDS